VGAEFDVKVGENGKWGSTWGLNVKWKSVKMGSNGQSG
jgi:hypothetical protein